MFCSEWALVKRSHPETTIIPLRCRCWSCDICRPGRAKRLIEEAKAGRPNKHIVLTSRRRPGGNPHRAAQALSKAWRQVRREYIKEHGKGSLAFLAVFEATKQGWPHIHIVARCKWLDQDWLSKRMGKIIGSPVVWVEAIDGPAEVAKYIAKYIGKDPHRFFGVKRYWRSLDYLFPVTDADDAWRVQGDTWFIVKFNWRTEARYYVSQGYDCKMFEDRAVLTRATQKERRARCPP